MRYEMYFINFGKWIFLILIPMMLFGQSKVIVQSDSFYVTCREVVDIDSIYYEVYIARTYLDTTNQKIFHDTTIVSVPDTFMLVIKSKQLEGNYAYGMLAVDEAGNKSEVTWGNDCNDPNMGGQCWYQSNDITAPNKPKYVLPKFKGK
jgi:hypothetical protein